MMRSFLAAVVVAAAPATVQPVPIPPDDTRRPPTTAVECVPPPGRGVPPAERGARDRQTIADMAYEAMRQDLQRRGKGGCQHANKQDQ